MGFGQLMGYRLLRLFPAKTGLGALMDVGEVPEAVSENV